jgi:hypothetical protein
MKRRGKTVFGYLVVSRTNRSTEKQNVVPPVMTAATVRAPKSQHFQNEKSSRQPEMNLF